MTAPAVHPEHPRLAFRQNDQSRLRQRLDTSEGRAMRGALLRALETPVEALTVASHAAGHALLAWLDDDPDHAGRARALVEDTLNDRYRHAEGGEQHPLWAPTYKAIYRAPVALGVAYAYDLAAPLWDADWRAHVATALADKARELIAGGGHGWNSHPWSNWHGITRGAAGVAALAAHGDVGDLSAEISQARDGVLAHLATGMGGRGWTAEGFNYLRYTLCNGLLPFFLAWQTACGEDLAATSAARWFLPLYLMQGIPAAGGPVVPMFGGGDAWWTRDRWRGGDLAMGMAIAPSAFRGAARWLLDRCVGPQGDGSFDITRPHDAIAALAHYPLDVPEANPATALGHAWQDVCKGYYVFRNAWRNADDLVVAFNLNSSPHRASHSFRDAGGLRLFGLGGRWIDKGPGNPYLRDTESVIQVPGCLGWHGGTCADARVEPDGSAVIAADLSEAYVGGETFGERIDLGIHVTRTLTVDFSASPETPVTLTLHDRISGAPDHTWVLHTGEGPITVEGSTFTIAGTNGASLHGKFVQPAGVRLAADGPTLRATGGEEYLVRMVLRRGAADAAPG